MASYSDVITRDASNDPLELPEEVSQQVIQQLPASSVVMANSRRITMSTKKYRQPVLDVLPDAYWVDGDTGLKQTTKQDWANINLTAEPLAALVVVPDEYMDDSGVPIWAQVRPRLVEAIGRKIDKAALFGVDKPATWTADSIYDGAIAAGNAIDGGTGDDMAADIAEMGRLLAVDGFDLNRFAAQPGFRWRLIGLRSTDGIPIYAPPAGEQPGTLFGYSMPEAKNGAWDSTKALVIGGDWEYSIVGVRQDITFQIFDSAVITDDDGVVVFNAMQQDSKIMRVVCRVAWTSAAPTNALGSTGYPFAVLKKGSLAS